jgi:hypothetical protein
MGKRRANELFVVTDWPWLVGVLQTAAPGPRSHQCGNVDPSDGRVLGKRLQLIALAVV